LDELRIVVASTHQTSEYITVAAMDHVHLLMLDVTPAPFGLFDLLHDQ
jgi:hypothetical protein